MTANKEIVAGDIGGTNARFCLARIEQGRVVALGETVQIQTRDVGGFAEAWGILARETGRPLPREAAIAIACPVQGEVLKLTNTHWSIRPAALKAQLGLARLDFINDFGAVGHSLSQLQETDYVHLAGPPGPLPAQGTITIVGPGTGLGVAQVLRTATHAHVLECEGGHISFAPLDAFGGDPPVPAAQPGQQLATCPLIRARMPPFGKAALTGKTKSRWKRFHASARRWARSRGTTPWPMAPARL